MLCTDADVQTEENLCLFLLLESVLLSVVSMEERTLGYLRLVRSLAAGCVSIVRW